MHPQAKLKLYRNYWNAVWREDGTTKRQSLRTQNYESACRRFEHWKRYPDGPLVRHAAALYLAAKQDEVIDHERLRYAWLAAGDLFGPVRPEQVTKDLCREYIAHRRRLGRSDGQ